MDKHRQEHNFLLQTLLEGGFDAMGVPRYGKKDFLNSWTYRKYLRYLRGKQTSSLLETVYYAENVVCYIRGLVRNNGLRKAMKDTWYIWKNYA